MEELIKAVIARYSSSAGADLRAVTTGGMWLSQAPESAGGVYIVLTPVSAPIEHVMGGTMFTQDCDLQFTVATITGSASDVVTAVGKLTALYDFCSLTLTGYSLLVSRRLSNQGPIRDDFTTGYSAFVEYRFTIGK